jgi:hypothetical protein
VDRLGNKDKNRNMLMSKGKVVGLASSSPCLLASGYRNCSGSDTVSEPLY